MSCPYFWTKLISFTAKGPLWARTSEITLERRFLEIVSGQECVTETAVSSKQGRVWAGHQPTLSGVLSQGSDLEPRTSWRPLGLPCYPHPPWQPLGARPPRPGGGTQSSLSEPTGAAPSSEALKSQWLLPSGAGAGSGGVEGRAGKQIKPREARGGDRTLVPSHLRLCNSRPTPQPRWSSLLPGTSAEPGAESGPTCSPCPDASRPFCCPRSAFSPQTSPSSGPGRRWASRWRQHASWCAAPAPWSPHESKSISRATAPSPLSMGAAGLRWEGSGAREGLGSCLSFQSQYREDSVT